MSDIISYEPDLFHLPPTDRQRQVLQVIKDFANINGCWPGLADLSRSLGISKQAVILHLTALMRRGLIYKDKRRLCHNICLTGFTLQIVENRQKPVLVRTDPPRLGG